MTYIDTRWYMYTWISLDIVAVVPCATSVLGVWHIRRQGVIVTQSTSICLLNLCHRKRHRHCLSSSCLSSHRCYILGYFPTIVGCTSHWSALATINHDFPKSIFPEDLITHQLSAILLGFVGMVSNGYFFLPMTTTVSSLCPPVALAAWPGHLCWGEGPLSRGGGSWAQMYQGGWS